MTITFYTNPNSRGRIVCWMLEEIGCAYDTVVLNYQRSSEGDPWGGAALERPQPEDDERNSFFNELNPIGKVPAIVHEGRVISESAAICTYLAEAFPEAQLSPTSQERADYYRWMFFTAGPVEQAVTNLRAGFTPTTEQEFFLGYGNYERTVAQLERAVSARPYVAGERFTAADVYVGSHVGWGLGLQTLPNRQAFVDYAQKLMTRPAYQRAVAKDNQLLGASSGTSG